MLYQEVIDNIKNLGFADDDEMEEFAESGLLYDAINRAITEINLNITPIYQTYEFEIGESDTGYLYINMSDVDDMFLDFANTPVLYERDGADYYQKFSDFQTETENTIVINADENKGSFRVFYKAAHTPLTGDDERLAETVPLPLKVHHLVPLLAAYYVWQEDEPAKAAQYYNMYEQRSAEVTNEAAKIRVRIIPGGL